MIHFAGTLGFGNLASLAGNDSLFAATAVEKLEQLQAELRPLSERYDVVVANPPYMGSKNMNRWLGEWIKENYADVKSDLFSSFIVRNLDMGNKHAQLGFMTPYVWMFIGSYEKLRKKLISQHTITSLIQLEYSGFAGATVPICTFTLQKNHMEGFKGGYIRLSDFPGADQQASRALEALADPECGWLYRTDASGFEAIPGSPIAYWASAAMMASFNHEPTLSSVISVCLGMTTADNNRFVRNWWEISRSLLNTCASNVDEITRWAPYNKGGEFRKWYGNQQFIVNWENDGEGIRLFTDKKGRIRSTVPTAATSLKECLTWSKISSGKMAVRYFPSGSLFDVAGACGFSDKDNLYVAMAFLNSSVSSAALSFMSPTLNFEGGQIRSLPFARNISKQTQTLLSLVASQIGMSQADWDSFETSWDFKRHPFCLCVIKKQ